MWGSLGIVVLLFLRRLTESPRWHESRGEYDRADAVLREIEEQVAAEKGPLPDPAAPAPEKDVHVTRAPLRLLLLLLQKRYLGPTLLLTILWVTQTIGFFGYSSWAPTLLAKEGFSVESSIFYVALTTVGAPLGSFLAAQVTDRFERKWCLVVFGTAIAICGLLYGLTFNPILIVVFGFLVNLIERGYTALAYAYSPELLDIRGRSLGTGVSYRSAGCRTHSAQLGVDEPTVGDQQNCGNILAGVGPFAVERGLVRAGTDDTTVRIRMVNSDSIAVKTFPTPKGRVEYRGNVAIAGFRRKAGQLMGLGDVSGSSVPKAALLARPRDGGQVCTRSFIPVQLHTAIGAGRGERGDRDAAARRGRTRAHRGLAARPLAGRRRTPHRPPAGRRGRRRRRHAPAGVRSGVVRTARKLFDGIAFPRGHAEEAP